MNNDALFSLSSPTNWFSPASAMAPKAIVDTILPSPQFGPGYVSFYPIIELEIAPAHAVPVSPSCNTPMHTAFWFFAFFLFCFVNIEFGPF